MKIYTHTLTEVEIACGVTLDQVADVLPECYMSLNEKLVLPANTPPALASSVARAAFAGAPVEFVRIWEGCPVYIQSN